MSRRIDDHSSWMGKGGAYPLPEGCKMKTVPSAMDDGQVTDERQSAEDIVRMQDENARKAKSQNMKAGYRN